MNTEINKSYYYNGNLWYETPFKNGVRHGIRKSYRLNGNLLSETSFKNNQLHGIRIYLNKS
jgi:antitoxin component YwqK of YwqJK toxin-antitoxin module